MLGSRIAAAVALAVSTAPLPALAATITFDALAPGAYAGHTEDGFIVTATGGVWNQFLLGNPLFSILGASASASLMVSESGGAQFLWESIDLSWFGAAGGGYGVLEPGYGPYDFQITGFRSGASVLSLTGGAPDTGYFETIHNPDTQVVLDALSITFTAVYASGFHVENIVLATPVPEPGTAICVGLGLGVLGVRARRRAA